MRVLVAGATGYVGGKLVSELVRKGCAVRCLVRDPARVGDRFGAGVEVVRGDVLEPATLGPALAGIGAAFYLVHSLGAGRGSEEKERRGARNFGDAAHAAGVGRIVYLGGLGHDEALSPHLASRQETGRQLAAAGVPVIEFRASVIIGAGSLSFEMIRALVERLPVMVTPKWVTRRAQPIAIEDTLAYLLHALELPARESTVYEIGGAEEASYLDLMRAYARARGLRRLLVPVPVLTPRLSSLWLGLVTPLQAKVGRKLVDSIRHDTVVRDPRALADFPVRPLGVSAAIERALAAEDREIAAVRWSKALAGLRFGSRIVDSHGVDVAVPPAAAFAPIRRIGGDHGWYGGGPVLRLRGVVDRLVGGPGYRRGRCDPEEPREGETLDFWRVERYERDRHLRLSAEMRMPGRAWLQFDVEAREEGSHIRQTAIFDPKGVLGRLYWYAAYPFHWFVFRNMLAGIARRAEAQVEGMMSNKKS